MENNVAGVYLLYDHEELVYVGTKDCCSGEINWRRKMRLIDADELIEVLNKKSVPFNANVNDAILTAPTVDAVSREKYEASKEARHILVEFADDLLAELKERVEVVRCKDCKYFVTNYAVPHCGRTLIGMKKSDYCSFGERRGK